MDEALGVIAGLIFIGGFIWFIIGCSLQAAQSVNRTARAIGEWNKKQLGEKNEH